MTLACHGVGLGCTVMGADDGCGGIWTAWAGAAFMGSPSVGVMAASPWMLGRRWWRSAGSAQVVVGSVIENIGCFMPLIDVLWYLDKYLLDCGNADAVVVVDETPAMAAKIAMSDLRTKVAFLAVSAIKQKDLTNAFRGALQHYIIMWYILEPEQTEQGVTAAA